MGINADEFLLAIKVRKSAELLPLSENNFSNVYVVGD